MYLGLPAVEEIPEQVRTVVETFSPELEGYRGFLSTEQRIAGTRILDRLHGPAGVPVGQLPVAALREHRRRDVGRGEGRLSH